MLKDRGKIKWTALMLPEHVERLRSWEREDELRARVEPDEQQLEEWNYVLANAMETNRTILITHWQQDTPRDEELYVHWVDGERSQLRGINIAGKPRIISFQNIESISTEEFD